MKDVLWCKTMQIDTHMRHDFTQLQWRWRFDPLAFLFSFGGQLRSCKCGFVLASRASGQWRLGSDGIFCGAELEKCQICFCCKYGFVLVWTFLDLICSSCRIFCAPAELFALCPVSALMAWISGFFLRLRIFWCESVFAVREVRIRISITFLSWGPRAG